MLKLEIKQIEFQRARLVGLFKEFYDVFWIYFTVMSIMTQAGATDN